MAHRLWAYTKAYGPSYEWKNLFMKDGKGQSMTDEMNYEMAENIDYSERDLE